MQYAGKGMVWGVIGVRREVAEERGMEWPWVARMR